MEIKRNIGDVCLTVVLTDDEVRECYDEYRHIDDMSAVRQYVFGAYNLKQEDKEMLLDIGVVDRAATKMRKYMDGGDKMDVAIVRALGDVVRMLHNN